MAGLEPARACYSPTDFKSVASTIPPHRRGAWIVTSLFHYGNEFRHPRSFDAHEGSLKLWSLFLQNSNLPQPVLGTRQCKWRNSSAYLPCQLALGFSPNRSRNVPRTSLQACLVVLITNRAIA